MTKTIVFDLHFTQTLMIPLTDRGRKFMASNGSDSATPFNYGEAVGAGLHVTFENAYVRDWVTQTHKEEVDGDDVSDYTGT